MYRYIDKTYGKRDKLERFDFLIWKSENVTTASNLWRVVSIGCDIGTAIDDFLEHGNYTLGDEASFADKDCITVSLIMYNVIEKLDSLSYDEIAAIWEKKCNSGIAPKFETRQLGVLDLYKYRLVARRGCSQPLTEMYTVGQILFMPTRQSLRDARVHPIFGSYPIDNRSAWHIVPVTVLSVTNQTIELKEVLNKESEPRIYTKENKPKLFKQYQSADIDCRYNCILGI